MLAAAITLAVAQAGGPPVSASACSDGRCITESWPRSPYILFFSDGEDALDKPGRKMLEEFAVQHRWWPHLLVVICTPSADPRDGRRTLHLRQGLARQGYRDVFVKREGQGCAIPGGSGRARGFLAYQLDFSTVRS